MKSNQKEDAMLEYYFLEITQNGAAFFVLKHSKASKMVTFNVQVMLVETTGQQPMVRKTPHVSLPKSWL